MNTVAHLMDLKEALKFPTKLPTAHVDLDHWFTHACRSVKIDDSDEYNCQFLQENKNSSAQTKIISYYN